MRLPSWSQGWEGGRRGPHARPRERVTSRVRSFSTAPGKGHPAHRPVLVPERTSQRTHRARTEHAARQRGQREKEGHSPASARALRAPEVVTGPLLG